MAGSTIPMADRDRITPSSENQMRADHLGSRRRCARLRRRSALSGSVSAAIADRATARRPLHCRPRQRSGCLWSVIGSRPSSLAFDASRSRITLAFATRGRAARLAGIDQHGGGVSREQRDQCGPSRPASHHRPARARPECRAGKRRHIAVAVAAQLGANPLAAATVQSVAVQHEGAACDPGPVSARR